MKKENNKKVKSADQLVWNTLFWRPLGNIHLIQIVGQYPYQAYLHGNNSTLVCYKGAEELSLSNQVSGLKIKYLDRKYGPLLDSFLYIIKNARKIDILQCFHIYDYNLVSIVLYKLINPKGKVWLESDIDRNVIGYKKNLMHGSFVKRLKFISEYFSVRFCDLITAPSTVYVNELKSIYRLSGKKVKYSPYGFKDSDKAFDLHHKQKEFIFIGRLGTEQKNAELLVNAFYQTMREHDWKLTLIGSSTEQFLDFLSKKKEEFHDAESRCSYKGVILDREVIMQELARAQIFVLPSRWESSGIVLYEALSQGCYIIGSDGIPAFPDIVPNEEMGCSFRNNSIKSLGAALTNSIHSQYLAPEYCEKRALYARQHFTYTQIMEKVYKYLGVH